MWYVAQGCFACRFAAFEEWCSQEREHSCLSPNMLPSIRVFNWFPDMLQSICLFGFRLPYHPVLVGVATTATLLRKKRRNLGTIGLRNTPLVKAILYSTLVAMLWLEYTPDRRAIRSSPGSWCVQRASIHCALCGQHVLSSDASNQKSMQASEKVQASSNLSPPRQASKPSQ